MVGNRGFQVLLEAFEAKCKALGIDVSRVEPACAVVACSHAEEDLKNRLAAMRLQELVTTEDIRFCAHALSYIY